MGSCTINSRSGMMVQWTQEPHDFSRGSTSAWSNIRIIVAENLKNLKKDKKKNRGKNFRKVVAPWTYREVITRLTYLAQENRIRLELINPKNTSRRCAKCGHVAKANRKSEKFICQKCNHTADADSNAKINILISYTYNSLQHMVVESLVMS